MSEEVNRKRRSFLGAAATTIAAAELSLFGSSIAQAGQPAASGAPIMPGPKTPFGPIKQVDASVLNVGYVQAGPADGPAVLLLHGWPYDVHSFVDVAPLLASAGYRVIVPYLGGYGTTRFLSSETFRNAQQSVIALDMIALMDALKIKEAIVAGFDWGARTADIMAALWPERCKGLVSVSGYLITLLEANKQPLPPVAEWGWWYQYYFATERGRLGYDENRYAFAKLIWRNCSPKWAFDAQHWFDAGEVVDLVRDEAELELTRREAADAAASGVRGVPFFVFAGRFAVSGAQPADLLRAATQRALS